MLLVSHVTAPATVRGESATADLTALQSEVTCHATSRVHCVVFAWVAENWSRSRAEGFVGLRLLGSDGAENPQRHLQTRCSVPIASA